MNREQIRKELSEAAKLKDISPEDYNLLWGFLKICKRANQWNAFVNCKHISTGTYSWQSRRVWQPKDELREFVEAQKPEEFTTGKD